MTASTPAGILAPVPTPFDPATGDFAAAAHRRNVSRLLADGLDGVVVGGSTGEAPLLDADEQRRLVATAREALTDGKWLIAGTGSESTRETVAVSRAVGAEGAHAVLVRPPGYYGTGYSPASLVDHFRAVADASPVPVVIYNIPKYTHLALAPGLLQQLLGHSNIVGVKDSSGDVKNLAAYREAAPQWTVLVGSGALLYAALEMGCNGGIIGLSCYKSREVIELLAAFRTGDRPRAGALQERLAPLHHEIVGKLGPAGVKAAMDVVGGGLTGGPVRPPLAPLSAADRERVARLLAA